MVNVISVRFRNGTKSYYFDPRDVQVQTGQDVIVETAQGTEFAQCTQGNHNVPDEQVVQPLRPLLRIATENDRRTAAYNRSREGDAFDICEKKIAQHQLEMKLVRVECSFDGSKIVFFFTADGRVDFRELVKDLASVFRSRIELRQIGVRDEAKMVGGLGICGRPFCCAAYMDEFVPVSIKMAKTQNLSLNPTKISGTCGRLMCCLKYEQDAYEDAIHRLPKSESFVQTPDGVGNVSDVNLLKETVTVKLDDRPESPRSYHNCEVCVLRNGKGSRDGIVIPAKAPERYTPPRPADAEDEPAADDILQLFASSEADMDLPEGESAEGAERSGRRRRRGRRGSFRANDAPQTANSDAAEREATPVKVVKAAKPEPADTPEIAGKDEKAGGGQHSRNRHRNRHRGGQGAAGSAENGESVSVPVKHITVVPSGAEAAPRKDGERRRPHHRGGRHNGHRGGGNKGGSADNE